MLILYLSVIDIQSDKLDFEKFYRLYKDDVFAYALSILKNREDAEDASQNTWFWVAKNMKCFRSLEENSVRLYLIRIVKSRAIDIYRKNKRNERLLAKDMENDRANGKGGADEDTLLYEICREEELSHIVCCIRSLDEIYRDVLHLYYLGRNTTAEIAKLLGIKESTVRQRLSRGRKILIALLKEKGVR